MTSIAIVPCHATEGLSVEARELAFARLMRELGHDVSIWCLTNQADAKTTIDPSGVVVKFFTVDDKSIPAARKTSQRLVSDLLAARPDVVLFKGLGYQLITDSLDPLIANGAMAGAILGGKWSSPLNVKFDAFFIEYSIQENAIRTRFRKADAWMRIMPKLIAWETSAEADRETLYDVCVVGSLIERKNHLSLAPLFGKCRIAIVGDGPLRGQIADAARGHPDVHMLGSVEPAKVREIMHASRVLVHPSLWEGLPRVSIEGFSCGLPLVGLRSTLEGALGDLDFALLAEQERLADTVLALLADEPRRRKLSEAALAFAAEHHGAGVLRRIAEAFDGHLRSRNV